MTRTFNTASRNALCAIGCALLATTLAAAEPRVSHEFENVRSTAARHVVIEIPTGNVTIRNGAAGSISVRGTASRDFQGTRERDWAQKVVNDSSVDVYTSGDEAIVRRRFGANADSFRGRKFSSFDVTIEVPAGVAVDIKTSYGNVSIEGVYATIDSSLRAGDILFRAPKSTVKEMNATCRVGHVYADLGDETVTREGLFPGKTRFYNPTGTTRANLHVTTGDVRVELTR